MIDSYSAWFVKNKLVELGKKKELSQPDLTSKKLSELQIKPYPANVKCGQDKIQSKNSN